MYIKTSPGSPPQQVTFNGEDNEIFNGVPDWVYEGELQMMHNAHLCQTIKPVYTWY